VAAESLGRLRSLTSLDLRHTHCGGPGLSRLAGCRLLRRLDLSWSSLRDEGLAALALALRECLQRLSVADARGLSNAGLAALPKFRALASLDLGAEFEVNDAGLAALGACGRLTSLRAGSFSLAAGAAPAGGFPALARLRFGGGFASAGLAHLFPALPALRRLSLRGINAASDAALLAAVAAPALTSVTLRGGCADALTAGGVAAALAAAGGRLCRLSLVSCPGAASAAALAEGCAAMAPPPPLPGRLSFGTPESSDDERDADD
jgi:hypothetical protein